MHILFVPQYVGGHNDDTHLLLPETDEIYPIRICYLCIKMNYEEILDCKVNDGRKHSHLCPVFSVQSGRMQILKRSPKASKTKTKHHGVKE